VIVHQSVEIAVWLVAYPREHVVDCLFEAVFELCSERRGFWDESLRDVRLGTKTKETVGQHLKVPATNGTVRITHLAVSKAEILLRVLEECLDSPSVRIAPNDVGRGGVDLIRRKVLTRSSSSSSVTFSAITSRSSPNFEIGSVFVQILYVSSSISRSVLSMRSRRSLHE